MLLFFRSTRAIFTRRANERERANACEYIFENEWRSYAIEGCVFDTLCIKCCIFVWNHDFGPSVEPNAFELEMWLFVCLSRISAANFWYKVYTLKLLVARSIQQCLQTPIAVRAQSMRMLWHDSRKAKLKLNREMEEESVCVCVFCVWIAPYRNS